MCRLVSQLMCTELVRTSILVLFGVTAHLETIRDDTGEISLVSAQRPHSVLATEIESKEGKPPVKRALLLPPH